MSDAEPEATFQDALTELIRIFRRKGTPIEEITEALEIAALDADEASDDEPEPEVGGDAA
jgi:DNA-binding transcriptional MerR regulator